MDTEANIMNTYYNQSPRTRWQRLYRFARITRRTYNPTLVGDVLSGMVRPCAYLAEIIDPYLVWRQACIRLLRGGK